MAILAGDTRVRPSAVDRERKIFFRVPGVPVTEMIVYRMKFADLAAIGGASSVEIAVGPKRWSLKAQQITTIRECVSHLLTDSAGSKRMLDAKAEAERLAVQAKADAIAAERMRLDPYRTEFAAAVEKARQAGKRVPKSQYATTGEKIKWRTLDREIDPIVKKHNLNPKDIQALLSEYPDFRVRYKIQ